MSAAWREDVNRRLIEDVDDGQTVVRATTDAEGRALADAGADYVLSERGIVGEHLVDVVESLDDADAFSDRLQRLTELALAEETHGPGGESDV